MRDHSGLPGLQRRQGRVPVRVPVAGGAEVEERPFRLGAGGDLTSWRCTPPPPGRRAALSAAADGNSLIIIKLVGEYRRGRRVSYDLSRSTDQVFVFGGDCLLGRSPRRTVYLCFAATRPDA